MNKLIPVNIIRFVALVLFQVLILNQIQVHGFISPYLYPLFILLLPFQTPRALLLLLGFITGIMVDIFANTPGLHAAATVFLAYMRPAVISLNRPPGGYDAKDKPNIKSLGFNWFLIYTCFAILLHHAFYFFIEVYSLAHFFLTMAKIIFSSFFSILLIVLYEYLFQSNN